MRVPTIVRRRRPFRIRGWIVAVVVVGVLLVLSLRGLARFYTDYLWFDSVGFDGVWLDLILARVVPAAALTAVFFVMMLASLTIADRLAPRVRTMGPEDEFFDRYQQAVGRFAGRIRIGIAAFLALVAGASAAGEWRSWILFRNAVSFGIKDPQFHRDVGFFVFRLPFIQFVVDWLFAALVIVLIATAVAHYFNGGIRLQSPYQRVTPQVKAHLSVILALMALVKAVGYYYARFQLDFSQRGVVEGASYTDVHAELPALTLLIAIAVIAAGLFIWNIWRRGWVLPIIAVGLWALISLVVGTLYPAFVQNFRVNPNELAKERKYIRRNIDSTRDAFGLNARHVQVNPFDYRADLTTAALAANSQTINNARLWDPAELLANYTSFQQLGTFYRFGDADVDRYTIDGKLTQVLLAARELNRDNLPSQSWVSRHLVYTHGYGLAVSPSNRVDTGGQPQYLLKDIPPVTTAPGLETTQPRVYYSENIAGYNIVDGLQQEFDFPRKGRADATTRYRGKGGVQLSSFIRQAAFALRFGDINPLISSQVTSKSRILFLRDIRTAVAKAAPFLSYDADPYPVILGGKVLWVMDGFTTSDNYPYSQTTSGSGGLASNFNYVRNSVKVTIDAYEGTIRFYVIDRKDPVIRAYEKAFPELFTDGAKLPKGLAAHLRFPEDLFTTQTDVYASYHMTDPTTFFNKTDLWEVSPDPGSGQVTNLPDAGTLTQTPASTNRPQAARSTSARQRPIYLLIKLPGEQREEFLILRPFVPVSKNNQLTGLVSFMVAKSDPGSYGKLESFVLPTGRTVFGPSQVDSTINTTDDISRQFSLLGQRGSVVIQGSLQLIPVENSILYIRPVYVQAQQGSQLPSFRFVIVFYKDQAKIGPDLLSALGQFSDFPGLPTTPAPGTTTPTTPTTPATPTTPGTSVADLVKQANDLFAQAQDALAAKDLAKFQSLINQVGDKLAQAQQATGASAGATTSTTAPSSTSSTSTTAARGTGQQAARAR